jgi:gamma-glutamylcyclotransferase
VGHKRASDFLPASQLYYKFIILISTLVNVKHTLQRNKTKIQRAMSAAASSTVALAPSATSNVSAGTLYFSYGSNMWLDKVARRCPHSEFIGIARLPGYRWIINARGSANVIQVSTPNNAESKKTQQPLEDITTDAVWDLVYHLTPADDAKLDIREHVPDNFTKEMLPTQYWPGNICKAPFDSATEYKIDVAKTLENVDMLVYVSRLGPTDNRPRDEYIVRMNEGISDALKVGVPK